ncbi:very-long-chain (3R)-3-hydroxyacyl-CoA dehydratase 1 isoform X2 [Carettochelys insculpta]|uniref:very-long-chain (3R)-3-hydroxyacyl-CoA dehydratase 1 isoform X2 n=1 Tax=Carettochelys insculpta TaxID=44489 RepID=UPI003EC048A4
MASSEEDGAGNGSLEEKGGKRRLGALATAWLIGYNIAMTAGAISSPTSCARTLQVAAGVMGPAEAGEIGAEQVCHTPPSPPVSPGGITHGHRSQRKWWLVLAIAMARFYLQKGTYKGLYKTIQKTLKFFQTFAVLEVVHCAVVHTSMLVTGVQLSSRIFMVWFITHSIKQIQNEESVILFLVVWTMTEITRYSFYTFNLLNHLPYFIKWARYNFFIILYPVGVAGELLTIYAALPYVKKTGIFSLRLPNKYNVSFDYYYFLIIVMASYIPLFPQLYFHMLRQRRKVLHGEVIVEKDD